MIVIHEFGERKQFMERKCEEYEKQLEEDIDNQREEMKLSYNANIERAKESNLSFKGEAGILRKKIVVMNRECEDILEGMNVLQEKEKELHEQIGGLDREISAHKQEIKVRDEVLDEKERVILDLKKRNQELEKFKFVLDYKIKELNEQIEPREASILRMRQQINEVNEELRAYHKTNTGLDAFVGDLRISIEQSNRMLSLKRQEKLDYEAFLQNFKADIEDLCAHIQEPNAFLTQFDALTRRYKTLRSASRTNVPSLPSPSPHTNKGSPEMIGSQTKGDRSISLASDPYPSQPTHRSHQSHQSHQSANQSLKGPKSVQGSLQSSHHHDQQENRKQEEEHDEEEWENEDMEEEFKRQEIFLHDTIRSVKKEIERDSLKARNEEHRIIEENLRLLREMADQRERNRVLKTDMQVELGVLQKQSRERMLKEKRMQTRSSLVSQEQIEASTKSLQENRMKIGQLREVVAILESKLIQSKSSKELIPLNQRA
jgi:hypothetical protein